MPASVGNSGMDEASRQKQFLKLYVAAEPSLHQFLQILVHDPHLFDDICQAVALRLWEKFDTFDASRSVPFRSWARGVAAKVVQEWRRSERHAAAFLSPEAIAAIVDGFDRSLLGSRDLGEYLEVLEKCLSALPDHSRRLLEQRYAEELPFEEIARRTGRQLQATYKFLQRLVHQLGECIEARTSDQELLNQGRTNG